MNPCQPSAVVSDTRQLAAIESAIRASEQRYVEVGQALSRMRRLFPNSDAFESRVKRVFGWCRSTVYQKIQAAELAESVRNYGPVPDTEYAALALAQIPDAERGPAWAELTKTGPVSYAALSRYVEGRSGRPPGAAPGEVSADTLALFHSLPDDVQVSILQKAQQEAKASGRHGRDLDHQFDALRATIKLGSLIEQLHIDLCGGCQGRVEKIIEEARRKRKKRAKR